MTIEDRVLRLENAYATLTELVGQVKSQTDILIQLARSADERMDTHQTWINQLGEAQAKADAAQANADARIAALADAQIRTEDIIREGRSRADEAFARLADAQAHTDQRLDALIDIINNGRKA